MQEDFYIQNSSHRDIFMESEIEKYLDQMNEIINL